MMNAISERRFRALVRSPIPKLAAALWRELEWFEAGEGRLLGAVVLDRTDADYSWAILCRDATGEFRAAATECSLATQGVARAALAAAIAEALQCTDEQLRAGQDTLPGLSPDQTVRALRHLAERR